MKIRYIEIETIDGVLRVFSEDKGGTNFTLESGNYYLTVSYWLDGEYCEESFSHRQVKIIRTKMISK